MKYLIVYDPRRQKTLSMQRFADSEESKVNKRRLELEIQERHAKNDVEILVLQARDEASLKITHARYFGKIDRKSIHASFGILI